MSHALPDAPEKRSAAARAEAAAWIARLHGPNRTLEVEAGLKRWLAESRDHAAAFELLTDTWEKSARLRRHAFEQRNTGIRLSLSRAALAGVAIAILTVVSTLLYLRDDGLTTAVGEQRTVTLSDGTRVSLNTNTHLRVRYDRGTRRVELDRGEALFEVAKRPDWPFIVSTGTREVRALGTEFIVRKDEEGLSVTLVEGKVTISPPTSPVTVPSDAQPLTPGERFTVGAGDHTPRLDRPPLDTVMAWQRGQVALDSTSLSSAVAEMNRYSATRLVIADPQTAQIPISGVFRAGDSEDFARAVARICHLELRFERHTIILAAASPAH